MAPLQLGRRQGSIAEDYRAAAYLPDDSSATLRSEYVIALAELELGRAFVDLVLRDDALSGQQRLERAQPVFIVGRAVAPRLGSGDLLDQPFPEVVPRVHL